MTRKKAHDRVLAVLMGIAQERSATFIGFPSELVETKPLSEMGWDSPLTPVEWLRIGWQLFRDATDLKAFMRNLEKEDPTLGDLITAVQESHPTPEHRPQMRGV
jgi:hypothetical protein